MNATVSSLDLEERPLGGGRFSYKAARLERLGATEYTLVTIVVDVSGSVLGFASDLRNALISAVDACKRSPRSDNLLVRVVLFSDSVGIQEVHGFTLLADLNPQNYPQLSPSGGTPLFDATYASLQAVVDYGEKLVDQDYLVNGILFVITDGADTGGTATPAMIAQLIAGVRQKEQLESLLTILVGINTAGCGAFLDRFKSEGGLDQYVDVADADKASLAKLARFVSQSISSQSQSLGTGGASKNISATI